MNKVAVSDARSAWKNINCLSGRKATSSLNVELDGLLRLFRSSFQPEETLQSLTEVIGQKDYADDDPRPVTLKLDVTQVIAALKSLRPNTSPGIDGIPSWVFKEHSQTLAPAITVIFNKSLATGIFPVFFKLANVVPVPKCQNPGPNDFRPISLLTSLSKVLVRFVLKKCLIPTMAKRMDPRQFAFVPGDGKGTTCALTLLQHEVLSYLDKQSGAVRMLQVDLCKAFDKARHSVALTAMGKLGAPSFILKWLLSYLSGRQMRIKCGTALSDWIPISSNVPQGTLLAP